MQFIQDYCLLTHSQAKAKAECLKAHQERFLNQMETCITWEIATLDLKDHTTEASLWQIIMNIPDPANPASQLFHLVNMMFIKNRAILHFHPSRSQNVRDVVAGLCVYIKGLWQGVVDEHKFNKFFTDTVNDWDKDAWWDPTQKCMITQADEEMVAILKTDMDLIFADKKVILNVPGNSTALSTQQHNDVMSTSSVSTFRTTGTTPSWTTRKTKTKIKMPSSNLSASSDTTTMLSMSIFSEKDIAFLIECIMQAMMLQPNTTQPTKHEPPSGEKTGKRA